ncbi:hypothetical protein HPP92_024125, partial [Vanilla planifolia]
MQTRNNAQNMTGPKECKAPQTNVRLTFESVNKPRPTEQDWARALLLYPLSLIHYMEFK